MFHTQGLRWLTVWHSTVHPPCPPPLLPRVAVGAQADVILLLPALHLHRALQVQCSYTKENACITKN